MRTRTQAQMLAAIKRIDGDDHTGKHPAFIAEYYKLACESEFRGARFRADRDGDPDPNDTAHRSARGANSAVRSPDELPDVSELDLGPVKAIALSIGSYATAVRAELATAVLDRLRELGADQVADYFESAWESADLEAPSDDEAERAGAARGDSDTDEEAAKAKLAAQSRAQWQHPEQPPMQVDPNRRGRTKADVLDGMNPQAVKRRRGGR